MSISRNAAVAFDVEALVCEIQNKYTEVATEPEHGFHFHTGRPLAAMLAYPAEWVDATPRRVVDSFAGVGNPFRLGRCRRARSCSTSAAGPGSMRSRRRGRWERAGASSAWI